jgi:site-specific recombinase XerD
MNHELYAIEPEEAVNEYLDDRATEDISESTLQSHGYRLKHFIRWADGEDIENMNDLHGRHLQKFRRWRKHDGELNNVTWHTQITTFRVFINWCEDFQAVKPDLSQKVRVPEVKRGEDKRDAFLDDSVAHELIDYLSKYQYASVQHTVFYLMWRTGARVGGVHALDLDDYNSEEQVLEIRHRPGTDTPLKNGENGERDVFLEGATCELLDDYIADVREGQRDDAGREPLFTTSRARSPEYHSRLDVSPDPTVQLHG